MPTECLPRASRALALLCCAVSIAPEPARAQTTGVNATPAPAPAVLAGAEDYRRTVGRLQRDTLRVALEALERSWKPWGDGGPAIPVHVLAADGAAPRVPAPIIRVTAGTPVHVTLRNSLGRPLVLRGLQDRGARRGAPGPVAAFTDSVAVAPGRAAELRFTPTTPGTYLYYGRTLAPGTRVPPRFFGGDRGDGPMVGVLIVDPPGTVPHPDERVLLITQWGDPAERATFDPDLRMMINGRSWPHTERLSYAEGDTVRWRVVNATGIHHPMHLHGFHFRVDARGDQHGEAVLPVDRRPLAVTEVLDVGETMRVTWVPTEPGNWIFHCHLMRHMSHAQAAPQAIGTSAAAHPARGGGAAAGREHETDDALGLGGLVVGITVTPRATDASTAASDRPRRRLQLYTGTRPAMFGEAPGLSFVLQEGDAAPAPDSVRFPASPIVLVRGEPAEIIVRNRLPFPLGVHWHGLELESRYDGVPDWSGTPASRTPPIAPGDSLTVHITPPRAGTFMYHVHSEPGHELAQGLYGAFLVMEPGGAWNPATDHLFLLGSLGSERFAPPAVNGRVQPESLELRAGVAHRLRFMHISPDDEKLVTLLKDGAPVRWTPIAKDGADLPPGLVRPEPADFSPHVGETFDFRWTPEPGDYVLRIVTRFPVGAPAFRLANQPPHTMEIPLRVR